MKIGILTYHRAHNYGALLQAYALKRYIESLGHNVEFIDYWPDYHKNLFRIFPNFSKSNPLRWLKSLMKFSISIRRTLKRRKGYLNFIKHELSLQRKPKYKNKISLNNVIYDAIIYGSDQIWREQKNAQFKGFDDVYFGEHIICNKKISYAASMGITSIDPGSLNKLKNLLGNFKHISVRENKLQEIIAQNAGIKPELVLDPVFLLEPYSWLKLLPEKRIIKEKYIFFYQLHLSEEATNFVEVLKEKTNLSVIEIQGRINPFKFGKRYRYQTANPFDFLRLIRDAEIVVSTSFHGIAFSILFNKNFYALGMGANSDRANTLLQHAGLEERMINNQDEFELYKSRKLKINNTFNHIVEHSKLFLNNAIND